MTNEEADIEESDKSKLIRDYRSMVYLLCLAENNPNETLRKESITKGKELSDKLDIHPLIVQNPQDYVVIREDIERTRKVYHKEVSG